MIDEQFLDKMLSLFDEAEKVDIEKFKEKSFDCQSDEFVKHFKYLRDKDFITTDQEGSKNTLGLRFESSGSIIVPIWDILPLR